MTLRASGGVGVLGRLPGISVPGAALGRVDAAAHEGSRSVYQHGRGYVFEPLLEDPRKGETPWARLGLVLVAGAALGCGAVAIAAAPAGQRPLWIASAVLLIVAVALGAPRRMLLALVAVDVPLALDANLDYRDDAAALGALGGLSISLTTISIVLLWALRMFDSRPRPAAQGSEVRPVLLPLLVLVAVGCISLAVARDAELSVFEIALLVQSVLVFAYIATQVRARGDILVVLGAMLVGLAFEGALAVAEYAGFSVPAVAGLTSRVDVGDTARFGGTIGSPNAAGAYFGLLLVPALATFMAPVGRGLRWLAGCAFALGLFGLATTFSRGGWLGFAVALGIFCAIGLYRRWFSGRALAVVVIAVLLVAVPLGGPVRDRLTGDDAGAAASRTPLALTAAKISLDHLPLGVGANNYTTVLGEYRTRDIANTWSYTVHNKYLLVLAETGVVGLAAFLAFLVATLRSGWRASKARDPALAVIAGGLAAAVAGQCVHMGVDTFRGRPSTQGLLIVAGLLVALASLARAGRESAPR
jgi:putative inorganic carbon (HCO3(-)) transporter